MLLLGLFILVFIGLIFRRPQKIIVVVTEKPKPEPEYWDGPKPSKAEQEANLQRIFKIIEEHPNGVLATKNPEYVEEYLNRIELDLPKGVEVQK